MLTSLRKSSSVSSFCIACFRFTLCPECFFIFHLNVFLVSVCTRGFGCLLCWPRERGKGLVCTRRFSFHEFYNFLLFNFLIFIFFCKTFFLPTTFTHTHTHDPRPLPTTHDPWHLATLDPEMMLCIHTKSSYDSRDDAMFTHKIRLWFQRCCYVYS